MEIFSGTPIFQSMDPAVRSPLEQSREDALSFFSRMIRWGATPVAFTVALYRWYNGPTENTTRAVVLVAFPLAVAAVAVYLLRPSASRTLEQRGRYAVLIMSMLSAWGLFVNGPRAPNSVGMAIVLSLSVLFLEKRRQFYGVIAVNVAVGLLGVLLRQIGVLPAVPLPNAFGSVYDVATGVLMALGFSLSTYILWSALQNYRRGQEALQQRSEELLAAQAAAQALQRQDMLARLSTVLAGEVAEQLGALGEGATQFEHLAVDDGDRRALVHLRESGARATQVLRLLESLGTAPSTAEPAAGVRVVLKRVALSLQRILGLEQQVDVLDTSTRATTLPASKLEQILTHLALSAKEGCQVDSPLLIRAYDGLGDMSRSDGSRTWTIVEIECSASASRVSAPAPAIAGQVRGPTRLGTLLVELVVGNAGGRFEIEQRAGGVTYVLQLPSA